MDIVLWEMVTCNHSMSKWWCSCLESTSENRASPTVWVHLGKKMGPYGERMYRLDLLYTIVMYIISDLFFVLICYRIIAFNHRRGCIDTPSPSAAIKHHLALRFGWVLWPLISSALTMCCKTIDGSLVGYAMAVSRHLHVPTWKEHYLMHVSLIPNVNLTITIAHTSVNIVKVILLTFAINRFSAVSA